MLGQILAIATGAPDTENILFQLNIFAQIWLPMVS